jgi:phage shock protein A
MNIMRKLNTLLRAGARESAEIITDANAVRIYRQEVVDAEALLARRRTALAAMIATRKDLERETASARERVRVREAQIARLSPDERTDQLLQLAARDIAATEALLQELQRRHLAVAEKISGEELTLRRLLAEIREHRRELKVLEAQLSSGRTSRRPQYNDTIAAHLATLRETRAHLNGTVDANDQSEASMAEAMERVDGDPIERELATLDRDDASMRVAQVLSRLRGMPCPA